jgi:hypothetical protein
MPYLKRALIQGIRIDVLELMAVSRSPSAQALVPGVGRVVEVFIHQEHPSTGLHHSGQLP